MKFTTFGWFPRSISLAAQLLLTFVGLVAGTTIVLTVVAYRSSLESLEEAARRDVQVAAQSRERTLTEVLSLRLQRAQGFLASAESICAEPAGPRGFGWSEDCVRTMVEEFRRTERASGALMTFRGRPLQASGVQVPPDLPEPGAMARVVPRSDGGSDLLMVATRDDAALTIQLDSTDLLQMLADRSGLGRTGEVFLTNASGEFLTPSRYGPPAGTDASGRECCRAAGAMPEGAR
jgi:hypothetical protein